MPTLCNLSRVVRARPPPNRNLVEINFGPSRRRPRGADGGGGWLFEGGPELPWNRQAAMLAMCIKNKIIKDIEFNRLNLLSPSLVQPPSPGHGDTSWSWLETRDDNLCGINRTCSTCENRISHY
ncbi:hypothetical protein GWI33_011099 [Rhynchophorus ferrugineus]|uniref:Uncharacterized protein n=1 Tax=Rhynchophorus ferrugineus TaxID=354439 RepID=A0A834ISM5_RHYFE|nr:hypothetical protein GWI33_011099 [Rhynchophorus ferrugineus]